VTHYCVANMPGAYSRTATQALTNATSRFIEIWLITVWPRPVVFSRPWWGINVMAQGYASRRGCGAWLQYSAPAL